ncbi:protein DMP6-like [Impatiens glandulifera]|uniref:protein DMP6-like n=1 Tax=Impatiens glandulifera TaxID=253017 RepID=UPI001FB188F6|nr:protein DMP6-like [Impatiens glandulifera]
MEIKVANETRILEEHEHPLLHLQDENSQEEKTLVQRAISQTFQSTAHLAKLLPTGTVLAFQLLSPIFTNQGQCDSVSRSTTLFLVSICGLSCLLLTFTDSFKDKNGNVCYGLATYRGLWVIDGSATLPTEESSKYRIKLIDFMHAFMSIMVFAAIALFDQNVVNCFYPTPSREATELLTQLPVGIGVVCSMLFVVFPTERHGIGFPLTTAN